MATAPAYRIGERCTLDILVTVSCWSRHSPSPGKQNVMRRLPVTGAALANPFGLQLTICHVPEGDDLLPGRETAVFDTYTGKEICWTRGSSGRESAGMFAAAVQKFGAKALITALQNTPPVEETPLVEFAPAR